MATQAVPGVVQLCSSICTLHHFCGGSFSSPKIGPTSASQSALCKTAKDVARPKLQASIRPQ